LDRLDVKIIREFLQGEPSLSIWPARATIKPALRLLAKKLGVAESTIRDRYGELSSFLSDWTLMVNPGLAHARVSVLEFEVPVDIPKEEVLDELKLFDGMLLVLNYTGRYIACVFYHQGGKSVEKKIELIKRVSGCRETLYTDVPYPNCEIGLSKTDLRIIASRQADMRKSNLQVAKEIGVSGRTVKRRLAKLVEAGAVFPLACLNLGALRDVAYADLVVIYWNQDSRAKAEAEILSMVDDYLIFNGHFASLTEFNLMLPSVPMAKTVLDRVNHVGGVKTARIDFVEERLESYDILAEQVKREMARMAGSN
jgi:DNA-binding Lrp family transcriptional regulator